jgi:hypothetical protein
VFTIDNSATEFVKNLDLSVYPNPFKDFINIKFSKPTLFPVTIQVFDIRGRLVLEQQFHPSSLERLILLMEQCLRWQVMENSSPQCGMESGF